ncbi:hypothetical protein VNO78_10349 [Psophocarpus tetragonolobus]|uniref:Uncharacterized protein n=1 Tax=Psophocarpus tetragonolobus TaxID=3891 RepID=A0AAN9XMW5_PSOTE
MLILEYRFWLLGTSLLRGMGKILLGLVGRVLQLKPDLFLNGRQFVPANLLQNEPGLFDALVAALPICESGEEAQLKRISELQAENDAICQELQKQLEAAGLCPVLCLYKKSDLLS